MPDGRKGECGGSISPRANIVKLIKTVEDYYRIYPEYPAPQFGKLLSRFRKKYSCIS